MTLLLVIVVMSCNSEYDIWPVHGTRRAQGDHLIRVCIGASGDSEECTLSQSMVVEAGEMRTASLFSLNNVKLAFMWSNHGNSFSGVIFRSCNFYIKYEQLNTLKCS